MAERDWKDVEGRRLRKLSERRRFMAPFEEMERWFNEAMRMPLLSPVWHPRHRLVEMGGVEPLVDIFEEGDEIVVKAEIPGMNKEDINVNISGNIMTISGEKGSDEKVEEKNFYRMERSFGSFSRTLRLPSEISPEEAKATILDGVLEIRLPKPEKARTGSRKIRVM